MQSLSSCLPACLLLDGVSSKWKGKKFDIVDSCSAPGNKTIQLAEYLNETGSGRVFAFEKDPKRFEVLRKTLKKYEASNVKAFNHNFLEVKSEPKFKRVKFVLLDPSCSGSGMLVNYKRDQ